MPDDLLKEQETQEQETSLRDAIGAAWDELEKGDPPAEEAPPVEEPKETAEGDDRPKEGRPRDEQGRFKPKEEPVEVKPAEEPREPTEQPKAEESAPQPPTSWSIPAKAAWGALPPEVQQAIAKREQEVTQGFEQYAGYKNLKPFVERAQQAGQTLEQALHAYVGIEDLLRRDPRGGMMHIAKNMGLQHNQAAALFAGLAQALGASPHPGQTGQHGHSSNGATPPNDQTPGGLDPSVLAQLLNPIRQELDSLKTTLTSSQQAERLRQEQAAGHIVERFRSDSAYPFFSNLEERIADLFEKGMVQRSGDYAADLKAAYDMAARLDPDAHEALVKQRLSDIERKEKEKTDAAKRAAVSLKGAPDGSAAPPSGSKGDLRSDIEAAWDQLATQI